VTLQIKQKNMFYKVHIEIAGCCLQ